MASKTYVSRYPYYVLTGSEEGDPTIVFGEQNIQLPGTYVTDDEDEQEFIEGHSSFGIHVFEDAVPPNAGVNSVILDDNKKLRLLLDGIKSMDDLVKLRSLIDSVIDI